MSASVTARHRAASAAPARRNVVAVTTAVTDVQTTLVTAVRMTIETDAWMTDVQMIAVTDVEMTVVMTDAWMTAVIVIDDVIVTATQAGTADVVTAMTAENVVAGSTCNSATVAYTYKVRRVCTRPSQENTELFVHVF